MIEPKVTEEVSYRTVTSTKGSTTSNKRTIVSRTTNVNAVQVNCYDGDGKLKSKDMDQDSWEERDTHNYEWTGDRRPPTAVEAVLAEEEASRRVFNGDRQAIESRDDGDSGSGSGGTVVLLTSSNVCDTPSIHWTGTVNESVSNPGGPDGEQRSSETKLEGSKWVHSEESVSVSMGKTGLSPGSSGANRADIVRSLIVSESDANGGAGLAVVPLAGVGDAVGMMSPGATAVVPPALSPEQRRQMRRNLNREMSAKTSAEK